MKQRLSLIVLGGSGSRIKQVHFSKKQFMALSAIAFALMAAAVFGVVSYLSLHAQLKDKNVVERRLANQSEEVRLQRRQIQQFAKEINHLKETLVSLNKFRDQIRVIANIDQPENHDGLFGVGGSAPEDLAPDIHLTQSHAPLMKQMHEQINQLEDASQKQETLFHHLLGRLEEQKNLLSHTPAIRPARGWVTSTFSYRQSPFTGKREFHKGIDIANKQGTAIVATADGVVSFAGSNGSFGQIVVIDHGYGLITRYAHIEKWLKEKGERVRRGEVVALMGNTGRSTGPHLHYEVRLNGVPVNPEKYILN